VTGRRLGIERLAEIMRELKALGAIEREASEVDRPATPPGGRGFRMTACGWNLLLAFQGVLELG
jgi:hypothetical protein